MGKPKKKPDNVFKEAWGNMSSDMSKILPESVVKKLEGRKMKWQVLVLVTVLELVVLGVVGKFVYDWAVG